MSATWHARILASRALAGLAAGLLWASPAGAGCLTQIVGSTAVHNCNGKVVVSQTVGATTVHQVDGRIGVSQTVGATTIHNVDGKFGISQAIGNLILHSGPLFEDRGEDETAP